MALSTDVKYFTSSMVGAPVLSGTQGSLVAILDACLDTGFGLKTVDSLVVSGGIATATISTGHSALQYSVVTIAGSTPSGLNGDKRVLSVGVNTVTFDATGVSDQTATGTITLKITPAGWDKAFTGTNKAAYRSRNVAGSRLYYRFDDTGTYTCKVRGYETMTDVDTGTGAFPTVTQMVNGVFVTRSGLAHPSTAARDWFVIANDKFVYFGQRGYSTDTRYGAQVAAFGEYKSRKSGDAYAGMLKGNNTSDAAAQPGSDDGVNYSHYTHTKAYLPRDYVGLGGAVALSIVASATEGTSFLSGAGSIPYPNPTDYGLLLCSAQVQETATRVVRGDMPGLYMSSQNIINRFAPDGATHVLMPDVPDLPDRVVAGIPTSQSSLNFGITFFDITGPWGN